MSAEPACVVCNLPGQSAAPATTGAIANEHPLDSLTAPEVARASAAVRAHAAALGIEPQALRFNTVMLREPPKAVLLAFVQGRAPRPERRALVWVQHPQAGDFYEAVVALAEEGLGGGGGARDAVREWTKLEGVQPTTTPDDNALAEAIILADERIRRLLAERYGLADLSLVVFDPWSLHGTPEALAGRRLMQGFLYVRSAPCDNEYAHPLDMVPLVDLNARRVVHIDCYDQPARLPPALVNYHREHARDTAGRGWRQDLRPINVTQPQGPSFAVEGNLVSWQRWRLRVGFNAREGLVLHDVGFEDGGRVRPILHRASLAEMAVPYGQPDFPYVRKCAFDVGDYGMGFTANSLTLGCDCLGHIKYFDGVVNDARGEPVVIKNAVCLHEEDAGLLWKHTDVRLNHVEVRRNRRLVLQQVSTFANYEYAAAWHLYLDGTISMELKLTGILSTSVAGAEEQTVPWGIAVAPGVIASNHQHLFCVRLDPSIDDADGGRGLVVSEVNAEPLPLGDPHNPHGNAFRVTDTPLLSTHAAMRDAKPEAARCWKLKNPAVINPITGQPVAYKLLPSSNTPMLAHPESLVAKRAHFARHALFVTPYEEGQLFPSGDHVVQAERCLGLARWLEEDRPLGPGADPVVWHSFGMTHLPRVEDFPVMPCETVGFSLKPCGFFTFNPTLDLPPERNAASREEVTPPARGGGGPGGAPLSRI